jgi:glyoxylate/hydroxypyruvate reductase A
MTLFVAVSGWNPEPWVKRLSARLPGRTVASHPASGSDLAEARYALAWKPEHGLLARCPKLEVIFSLGAGVDHLLSDPDLPDVPLVRVVDPDLTARMAEWVTLQVLLHHRRQLTYLAQQKQRVWQDHEQAAAGRVRVGILGLGVLGGEAASVLTRLGYDVAGWARSRKQIEGIACYAGASELDAFLARTDILVNLLPLTDETRHLVDHAFLSRLARNGAIDGPVFINAGRGGSQVEADLARALTDGTLAGASLDVFETEPLARESPLWEMENVVITPHVAADSDPEAISDYIAEQILAHESGQPLSSLVDRSAGY